MERWGPGNHLPPDMLVMTATPIPRSLALAQFGDMDLSVLDEKPPGDKPIRTTVISDARMARSSTILPALEGGARAYWVCPLVEESEAIDLTAAEARFQELRARFGDEVRLVHGQMPADDRDTAMADFAAGRAHSCRHHRDRGWRRRPRRRSWSSSAPKAFGLAQLHQLRGRVGRGSRCLKLPADVSRALSESGRRRHFDPARDRGRLPHLGRIWRCAAPAT